MTDVTIITNSVLLLNVIGGRFWCVLN
jgi:hypothetical protein